MIMADKRTVDLYGDAFLLVLALTGTGLYFGSTNEQIDYDHINTVMYACIMMCLLLGPVPRFIRMLKNTTLKSILGWGSLIGLLLVAELIIGEDADPEDTRKTLMFVMMGVFGGMGVLSVIYQRYRKKKDEVTEDSEDGEDI